MNETSSAYSYSRNFCQKKKKKSGMVNGITIHNGLTIPLPLFSYTQELNENQQ